MWSFIVNITRVSNEKFYIGSDFVPGNNSNLISNFFKPVTGSLLFLFTILLRLGMTTRIKIKYTYKEFKMYRLKAKKSNYTRKSSLITKLIFFSLIFLQNTFKVDMSHEHKLKSIQKKDFFCTQSIQLCRNLSSVVLYENLNLLVLSKLKTKNHSSFCWFCLLLSGDVEFNPGPTNYPCALCGRGLEVKESIAQIVSHGCTQNVKTCQIQNTKN